MPCIWANNTCHLGTWKVEAKELPQIQAAFGLHTQEIPGQQGRNSKALHLKKKPHTLKKRKRKETVSYNLKSHYWALPSNKITRGYRKKFNKVFDLHLRKLTKSGGCKETELEEKEKHN